MKKIKLDKNRSSLVDDDVFGVVRGLNWKAHFLKNANSFYVRATTEEQPYLHWFVVGQPLSGFVVDHINGDPLDNRRENLRVVSRSANQRNRRSHRAGRLFGAYFHKTAKRWIAQARINGKQKYLGRFSTELAAHQRCVEAEAA